MYNKVNKIDTSDKKQLLYFLILNSIEIPPLPVTAYFPVESYDWPGQSAPQVNAPIFI